MNITFLIGNGFDLNLGLDTRYTDFLSEYKKLLTREKNTSKKKFLKISPCGQTQKKLLA